MINSEYNLPKKIMSLINSHREGTYWDFKQAWYAYDSKKSDMLHDIICMANNIENHDAYIVIGVRDDFTICGVEDDEHRRNTQNLTDFLRCKKFAGGFRPTIDVIHIPINEHVIDVIRIQSGDFVPYYLEEKYDKVRPYNIYTRVQDSNTPVDSSADLIHVEMLWKRRFHVLDSPLQKMKYFLSQKNNWIDSIASENGTKKYYKYAPEYTLQTHSIDGDAIETYMLSQLDKHGSWHTISLLYHQTVLFISTCVLLDGGRYMTVTPMVGTLCRQHNVFYYYLCKDSMKFSIYEFLFNDTDSRDYLANQRFQEEVLFFETEDERINFEIYVQRHYDDYKKYVQSIKNTPNHRSIPQMQDEYDYRLALKRMHRDYQISEASLLLEDFSFSVLEN